jgi:hypothetical protein
MDLRYSSFTIIFCAAFLVSPLSRADSCSNNAMSREEATARYRDFLKYVREKANADRANKAGIDELKAKRQQAQLEREEARKKHVLYRDEERRKFDSVARDQAIAVEEEAGRRARAKLEQEFAEEKRRRCAELKSLQHVDPHDEFEVGNKYEEFEYEEE